MLSAIALAALAAALFGFNVHIHHRGLDGTDGWTGAFLSLAAMSGMFWLLSPLFMDIAFWKTDAIWIFAGVGIIFPAFGQGLQILAISFVGAALTGALGTFSPVFAIIPAILFLGEQLNLQGVAGLTLMLCALLLVGMKGRKFSYHWPLWAIFIPLGASAIRGIAQPITKYAYQELPEPLFATMIMATISTLTLFLMAWFINRRPPLTRLHKAHGFFIVSGLINGLGIAAFNTALKLGHVTLVSPLLATTPLWSLFFGAFVFKREDLTRYHVVVAIVVMTGVILIVTR